MKLPKRYWIAGGTMVVVAALFSSAAAQDRPRVVGYIGANLFKAAVQVESMAEQRVRVTLSGQADERLTIEASAVTVTTTPDGLRIAADGQATLAFQATARAVTAEALEVRVARDGTAVIQADRMSVQRP